MRNLRARTIGITLFALLTLGQAHPFAQAWAMGQESHSCCCQTATPKPCDCDHKGHSSFKKKKFSCHEEKTKNGASYSPTPCGTKTESVSLNFRGEICLPRFASLILATIKDLDLDDLSIRLPKFSAVPDPPPPKQG
jgi:hypothetical protein